MHNLSPLLPTRFILRLPPTFTAPAPSERPFVPARHVGTLEHRGQLAAGETRTIDSAIWIQEPALVELSWELTCETGDLIDDAWIVRSNWTRHERGGVWKIAQTTPA